MPESLADILKSDPLLGVRYNIAQQRLVAAVRDPNPTSLTIVLMLKGNRAGGSFGLVSIWSAIMFGTRHQLFRGSPFGEAWPFRRQARIVAPIASLEDKGPIQSAIRTLFPYGRFCQSKGSGHGYYSQGEAPSVRWSWTALTYDQDPQQHAGANLGLVLMSEPPPQPIFNECITRLSGAGLIVIECTRLDLAGYLDDYVDAGSLILDGRKVGDIRVVRADIHDACAEHSEGHMAHSSIEATIAAWPPEEREARRTGKSLHLSGRIYPNWGEANELSALSDYHQEMWTAGKVRISSIIDPADRKPWACVWCATFPNEDVVAFAEWPPFDYGACKSSPVVDVESYRDVILETEATIAKPVDLRLIDGLFGAAIKSGRGLNLIQMLSAPCLDCIGKYGKGHPGDSPVTPRPWITGMPVTPIPTITARDRCTHRLAYRQAPAYDGSVRDGHILVRAAIGDPSKGDRPKLYAMRQATPNLCYGMRHYAFKEHTKEDRGLSSTPQLVYKDFPDTVRMGYLQRFHKWPVAHEDLNFFPTQFRGRAGRPLT